MLLITNVIFFLALTKVLSFIRLEQNKIKKTKISMALKVVSYTNKTWTILLYGILIA